MLNCTYPWGNFLTMTKPSCGVRPIALGEKLYQFTSCILCLQFCDAFATQFSSHQFKVATKGGCETIIHGIRSTLDLHPNCTPSSPTFVDSFVYFDSFLLQVFGHLLGPSSFDSLKGPLACKQVFLTITLGGINFILTSTIALITYLGSWAFVASIIVAIFMVDPCPFLF
jgi:hypothetical protein